MKKLLVFIILILGISTFQAQQEKIVEVPDINPEFVGGIEKLFEYLEENLNYPEMANGNILSCKFYFLVCYLNNNNSFFSTSISHFLNLFKNPIPQSGDPSGTM